MMIVTRLRSAHDLIINWRYLAMRVGAYIHTYLSFHSFLLFCFLIIRIDQPDQNIPGWNEMKWNQISSHPIIPGQCLLIYSSRLDALIDAFLHQKLSEHARQTDAYGACCCDVYMSTLYCININLTRTLMNVCHIWINVRYICKKKKRKSMYKYFWFRKTVRVRACVYYSWYCVISRITYIVVWFITSVVWNVLYHVIRLKDRMELT